MTQGNRHMGTKNLWYNTVCPYDWYTGTLVQKKLYQVLQAYAETNERTILIAALAKKVKNPRARRPTAFTTRTFIALQHARLRIHGR